MMGEVRLPLVRPGHGDARRPGFIGREPGGRDNVYVATGDSGMGMTHGTIAGMLLTRPDPGPDNPWATLYDPRASRCAPPATYVQENLNVAAQYADWVTGGDVVRRRDRHPGGRAPSSAAA